MIAIIYVTCSSLEEAKKISRYLLEKKLVACVNMLPINSMYHWQGGIACDNEVVMLCKTQQNLLEQVKQVIMALHSYEVPCIITFLAEANQPYYKWLCSQVQNS